jgi:hypothetical protein
VISVQIPTPSQSYQQVPLLFFIQSVITNLPHNVALPTPSTGASKPSHIDHSAPTPNKQVLSTTTDSASDTYSRLLLSKCHGFPLWHPEPEPCISLPVPKEYQDRGVSVGDVGILTPTGAFSFLFSACLPHDHPVNDRRVPQDFEPFVLGPRDVVGRPGSHIPGRVIATTSITWQEKLEANG